MLELRLKTLIKNHRQIIRGPIKYYAAAGFKVLLIQHKKMFVAYGSTLSSIYAMIFPFIQQDKDSIHSGVRKEQM